MSQNTKDEGFLFLVSRKKHCMPLSSRKEVAVFVHRKLLFRLRPARPIFCNRNYSFDLWNFKKLYCRYSCRGRLLTGFIIGYIVAKRMHKITWDEEASKVVGKMDTMGIMILVIYLLFAITRRWIFSYWLRKAKPSGLLYSR